MDSPLSDIRVLELGHALAGPFASVMLADFGAEVIKVEKPGIGDSLRAMGPQLNGKGIWWRVTGRNKRSVCIDLKNSDGLDLVKGLAAECDVVIENFRPGVLDRLGLGYADLSAVRPDLVMLSVSGFGQTGPYGQRGGFGKIAEAYSGATHLTGSLGDTPVHPGYSLGDATAGLMGAYGILLALRYRDRTGLGQYVDLALYEPLLRMIEWQVPIFELTGTVLGRNGARFPFDGAFITDICQTVDGEAIVVSAATTQSLESLRALLADEGLLAAGSVNEVDVVLAIRKWAGQLTREQALERLHQADVVAGQINTAADLVVDPHVIARENFVDVEAAEGVVKMPGVIPALSRTPGHVAWVGPDLGEHTDQILTELMHLTPSRIAELRASGVVG